MPDAHESLQPKQVEIVQLSPDDWRILRDLKIESLTEEPFALENPETAVLKYTTRTEAEWRSILSGNMSGGREGKTVMYFAKEGDQVIGMVSSIIPDNGNVAEVQHMYVKEAYRGQQIGQQLLSQLIELLQAKVTTIKLDVVATQESAQKLYSRLGFEYAGTSKATIDWVYPPLDEHHMTLSLNNS